MDAEEFKKMFYEGGQKWTNWVNKLTNEEINGMFKNTLSFNQDVKLLKK